MLNRPDAAKVKIFSSLSRRLKSIKGFIGLKSIETLI